MRLTLRTLLSYLDDTLAPAQAKAIGAKVAESEKARELMERIKQVTRRRRLSAPPPSGPGGMDPNTIADYLDNEVTPEKAEEVEQICQASDVHLAEVAACHQILTLVLGEPALVPPSSKQRMYALVKGPESIPFRKPVRNTSKDDNDLSSEIEPDQDETLRLGMPAVGSGSNRNMLLVAGGGVLAACLLVVAVWQLMRNSDTDTPIQKKNEPVAQADKKAEPIVNSDKKPKPEVTDKNDDGKPPPKKVVVPEKKGPLQIEDVNIPPPPTIPYTPANMKAQPIGKFAPPPATKPAVLLARVDKESWKRVVGENVEVSSGQMLVSLPGSKSLVKLDSEVEVTLWGNLPEVTLDPSTLESRATFHAATQLDADLTLDRGRVILRNKKMSGKDAYVRVRFQNPTLSQEEHLDVILEGSDSAVIVEIFYEMDREEPFYEDPKDQARKGPIANLRVFAYERGALVRSGDLSFRVDVSTQPILNWRSRQGVLGPPREVFLPPWFKGMPELKKDTDKLIRKKAIAAHDDLAKLLDVRQIGVALDEIEQAAQKNAPKEIATTKQVSLDTRSQWQNAIRCYAAIDDMSHLLEEFAAPNTPIFVRGWCLQSIQQWLAAGRDNDYVLLELLRTKQGYRKTESTKIMELFHFVSTRKAQEPATYQNLIEGLNNKLLPIRTLSHWHLLGLAPAGGKIFYDPAMPERALQAAMAEWSRLIPPGRLPSDEPPPPMKKEKKGAKGG